jgi:pimeloyl-ACP methyl ester carboxylesterase
MDHYLRSALRFDVTDSGPADGDVVVLLHGFPQQPSTWDDVAERLNAAGLRTLVPTMRGYTATNRPRPRRAYATEETAADVVALMDTARLERAHLVGHDFGGTAAWGVAGWYPERVATLTSVSTPHPAAFRDGLRAGQARASWYMALFQLPGLPEALARRTLMKSLVGSGLPAESAETYAAALAEPGAWTGAFNWYRGLPFSTKPVGRIRVPTTYVWGRNDAALVRSTAEATAKYVTGPYRFVDLDAGHWLPECEPEAVTTAILDRIRPAPGFA